MNSAILSCSHFIILYSYSRDLSFFSSFLTLLTSQDRLMDEIEGNPREESPLLSSLPPPYISLSDGSSLYSIQSSLFILCAPNLVMMNEEGQTKMDEYRKKIYDH